MNSSKRTAIFRLVESPQFNRSLAIVFNLPLDTFQVEKVQKLGCFEACIA